MGPLWLAMMLLAADGGGPAVSGSVAASGAEASCLVDLVGPLSFVVAASGAWSWYVDPARSGASIAVRGWLVLRPLSWLGARLGYARAWRTAADPVYATTVDRLLADVEFRPWRSTWFSLEAAASLRWTGGPDGNTVGPAITLAVVWRFD